MTNLALFAIFFAISWTVFGSPDGDRLRFSDRRKPEDSEYRTFSNRRPNGGSDSSIDNAFKIPIAVIKGTSAAAQAFSPQNTQTIEKIFDIPVTTLDAVGNFIKESRPQRNGNNNENYNNDEVIGSQRPLSPSGQRRQDRREEIINQREKERERRRLMDQERFFINNGHHSSLGFFSSLMDLLSGGGHHHGGHLFGSHGHGHGHGFPGKPPKRPLKPLKPFKPGNHGGHGLQGNVQGENGGYQVHEQLSDSPAYSLGILSWLNTAGNKQSDENAIQNKIAPGSEFRYDRQRPEFRSE